MQEILFYLLAVLTLLFGFLVVANPFSRNPVTSAMFLALTIISLAGLFVLLHAFFLAAVQILVYAGAVMVLFLFVIMLLDLPVEEKRRVQVISAGLGVVAIAGLLLIMGRALWVSGIGRGLNPQLEGSAVDLGRALFSQGQFLLPFEVVSLLLLSAMVGVILLSKKDLK
jgi:NADH-quinone oxidoreductase subunit J